MSKPTHSTDLRQLVKAPPSAVYRAIINAEDVAIWMVPDGMSCEVHAFEPREGGFFRISLTYEDASQPGKSSAHTDSYHGRFVRLTPDQEVVERIEFETDDVQMQGEMTVTLRLIAKPAGGTEVHALHADLPPGLSASDNETGWRLSLQKLAALVEARVGASAAGQGGA